VRSRKNIKQKKSEGSCKIFSMMEGVTAEYDSWEREEDLENTKKVVAEFERRVNAEVR